MLLIKNATIVNAGRAATGSVLVEGQRIKQVCYAANEPIDEAGVETVVDAAGMLLFPGIIDDQVHFREPGNTLKGDIGTESRAAAAGGVTSFMDMPNTDPPTTTNRLLADKIDIAQRTAAVNYAFFLGATNDNLGEITAVDVNSTAGIKMFLGSSTGSLLVDNAAAIDEILRQSPILVAAHCEDNSLIANNLRLFRQCYGDDIPAAMHADIRSAAACLASSQMAVAAARKVGGRLHILHVSTQDELTLLSATPLSEKNITAEVCVHHLWFNDLAYKTLGNKLKCNPAIKSERHRRALLQALVDGKIDIVATDHAPHASAEKAQPYTHAPSGLPLVQHSLLMMLELAKQGHFNYCDIARWMCHNPAVIYRIKDRGFVEAGMYADLVLVDPNRRFTVTKNNLLYKCGWSPLEGVTFSSSILYTIVNGKIVFSNEQIHNVDAAMPLRFDR